MTSPEKQSLSSKGPALSSVLATGSTWERTLVPIEPATRLALFGVTAVLLLVAVGQYFLLPLPVRAPGFFLFGWPWVGRLILDVGSLAPVYLFLTGLLVAGCVLTQGFSLAGRRLQIGLGALALVSAVGLLPALGAALLAVANLVAWVALAALVIGLIVGLIGAALSR